MRGPILASVLLALATAAAVAGSSTRFTNNYIDATVSLTYPGFEGLSVDSLGKEHFPLVEIKPPAQPWQPTQAEVHGSRVEYRKPEVPGSIPARWAIEVRRDEILLESHWSAADPPEPFLLDADTRLSHVTLLGLMETNGSIELPALMHFPDQGTFRITVDKKRAEPLGYKTTRKETKISFPGASREHPALTYHLKVTAIHPAIRGLAADARFDGFRRNWLNIFQLNPQRRILANNAGSDSCGFCYYEYGDIALATPPLAKGLTALDMVRQTLDRVIGGFKACGMPGYSPAVIGREDRPQCSADTYPSFLIAADDYVSGSKDVAWLWTNYVAIRSWADQMLATDTTGDGLIEYIVSGNSGSWPKKINYRPANWWDCLGFGHEDAWANALAYRALHGMERMALRLKQPADADRYRAAADKLKAAYFTVAALYNLGRIEDGDRILIPMLDAFAKGGFQGLDANKKSKDWKTWNGEGHGYEGFLNDNYYALLAVLDRQAALSKSGR